MNIDLMSFLVGLGASLVICNVPLYIYWRSTPPLYGRIQLSMVIVGATCLAVGLISYGAR